MIREQEKPVQEIERFEDVRAGDVMLGPIGGLTGVGVRLGEIWIGDGFRIGKLAVAHAGIVVAGGRAVGGPRLVQAMPGGAEEIAMTPQRHWNDRTVYFRLPEDYVGQAWDASLIARDMVIEGVDYSPLSYAALGAWKHGLSTPRLEQWIGRRRPAEPFTFSTGVTKPIALPVEAICSVLVDQAWSLTGKRIMQGVPHQCVTPGGLAIRLWNGEGVVRGGVPVL
jgi:hypothetical protein